MTTSHVDCLERIDWLPRLSVCVFCGARSGSAPAAAATARDLGRLLGEHGHDLIYGAGGIGLMAEVSAAAFAAGARVTGIVPRFLHELERVRGAVAHNLVVADDMFERKRLMISSADAFVALPGGFGTLDEVLEVVSLAYLGQCPKPLVLVDVDGTWEDLLSVFAGIRREGFTRPDAEPDVHVVPSAVAAVELVELLAPGRRREQPVGSAEVR